jgi:hypothetical protein
MSLLPNWDSIESTSRWSDVLFWAGIICLVLLAATEVASHIYGSRSAFLSGEVARQAEDKRKQDQDSAETRRKTEVEGLQTQLADAAKKAAEAAKKAEAVEKQAAPRHLTSAQQQAIFEVISPIHDVVVSVAISMGDTEAKSFAGDFVSVLRKAGWNVGEGDGINQAVYTGGPDYGVQVTLNEAEARAGRYPTGAEALIRALIAIGLTKGGFMNPGVPVGKIELRIGPNEPTR